MWEWESFGKQFQKPPLLTRKSGDDTPTWLCALMTSLPLRVWQLSTSSLWQPDECGEWVVTLATAMLSWPSPYILPDSPRWQWAQHTLDNAHAPTHTHTHTHIHKHFVNTETYTRALSFTVSSLEVKRSLKPALKHTLKQCTCPHAHAPLGIIMWYKEEYNLPWGKKEIQLRYNVISG